MASIRTTAGEFTGRSAETIVRREFGRTAEIRWSADRNRPNAGLIIKRYKHGTRVLAVLNSVSSTFGELAVGDWFAAWGKCWIKASGVNAYEFRGGMNQRPTIFFSSDEVTPVPPQPIIEL